MKNSLSEEGAALMNEEMRVSWGTGNGYRWMFDVCHKKKEKSQKQEPASQFIDYRRQVIKRA